MGSYFSGPRSAPRNQEPMKKGPKQKQSPLDIWRNSQKSSHDVVEFMQSSTSLNECFVELFKHLNTIRNRSQYNETIRSMQDFIQGEKSEEKDEFEERKNIFNFLQQKYLCSWLVGGNDISDKNLIEVERKSSAEKLLHLYQHSHQVDVSEAIIMNYPQILQKQAFTEFISLILDNYVYIDDQFSLSSFVLSANEQNRGVQLVEKRVTFYSSSERDKFYFKIKEANNLMNTYMEGINVFLKNDYPYGGLVLFRALENKGYKFNNEQIHLYLQTRTYELILDQFNHLQIGFSNQFKDLSMPLIIDLLLRGSDDFQCLVNLQTIHKELLLSEQFDLAIEEYAFSKQCLLSQCIALILSGYIKSNKKDQKFIQKVLESRFDLFGRAENEEMVKEALKAVKAGTQMEEKVKKIISIARLMNLFKINEKMKSLWMFVQNSQNQTPTELQYKALFFVKSLASQYFTLPTSRTIKLNYNDLVDLSKPESILVIQKYLYEKIFSASLSMSDIHQIVFQHMLEYGNYKEVKEILQSKELLAKFEVRKEMIEMLIIENMAKQMRNNQFSEISNDINIQLQIVKNSENFQVGICKSTATLFQKLQSQYIFLKPEMKEKIDINLLYHILEAYPQKINSLNFDEIYEMIRVITSEEVTEEKYIMTSQLILFKSVLAEKAFQLNHQKLGTQIILEIKGCEPPWLSTKIIKILQQNPTIAKEDIFGIALESCVKGEDLEYLMELWKERESLKKSKKIKVTEYFETQKKYLIIDNALVKDEDEYRNIVAEVKFGQKTLQQKKYELFFSLLGTDPERGFYHVLRDNLDVQKIYKFLAEGMKRGVIDGFQVTPLLYKCIHYRELETIPSFKDFKNQKFELKEVVELEKKKKKNEFFNKMSGAFICTFFLNEKFINTYINSTLNHPVYDILYDKAARGNIIAQLREEPMGTEDIRNIEKLCPYIGMDFVQLCIFNLISIANCSVQLNEKSEQVVSKLIVLTVKKFQLFKILAKLIEGIHSIRMLISICTYMKPHFETITDRHLQVLSSLAVLQMSCQFHGLIPLDYFEHELSYNPKWPISENHQKIVESCGKKGNIFVISKVMYFFYGMNPKVEKKILDDFAQKNENDEQMKEIKQRLLEE